ncbi:hypothetical protein Pelo_19950 [Pelomyxa schiedti]|nr:hypothetical protein Pelo_19950 [Pelomyxa schiedti]
MPWRVPSVPVCHLAQQKAGTASVILWGPLMAEAPIFVVPTVLLAPQPASAAACLCFIFIHPGTKFEAHCEVAVTTGTLLLTALLYMSPRHACELACPLSAADR